MRGGEPLGAAGEESYWTLLGPTHDGFAAIRRPDDEAGPYSVARFTVTDDNTAIASEFVLPEPWPPNCTNDLAGNVYVVTEESISKLAPTGDLVWTSPRPDLPRQESEYIDVDDAGARLVAAGAVDSKAYVESYILNDEW